MPEDNSYDQLFGNVDLDLPTTPSHKHNANVSIEKKSNTTPPAIPILNENDIAPKPSSMSGINPSLTLNPKNTNVVPDPRNEYDDLFKGVDNTDEKSGKPWYESGTNPPDNTSQNFLNQVPFSILGTAKRAFLTTNPATEQLTNQLEQEKQLQSAYQNAKQNELDQHAQDLAEHQQKLAEAHAEHDRLIQEHELHKENLEKARLEHNVIKDMKPEHKLYDYEKLLNETGSTEVPLIRAPLGGANTEKYAKGFGATDEEASQVPSMSVMQKKNIPGQAESYQRISGVLGGQTPNMFEGYPLLTIGPEGEKLVRERMTPEYQQQKEQESARNKIEQGLINQKAKARTEYENAQQNYNESLDKIKEQKSLIKSLKPPVPPKETASDIRESIKQNQKINALADEVGKADLINSRKLPKFKGSIGDEYFNTFPTGDNAGDFGYAHELLKGIADSNIDEETKTLFKSELNKIQTRNPRVLPAIKKYYSGMQQ